MQCESVVVLLYSCFCIRCRTYPGSGKRPCNQKETHTPPHQPYNVAGNGRPTVEMDQRGKGRRIEGRVLSSKGEQSRVSCGSSREEVFGLLFQTGHGDLGWNRYSTHLVFRINSTQCATVKVHVGLEWRTRGTIGTRTRHAHKPHTISGKDPTSCIQFAYTIIFDCVMQTVIGERTRERARGSFVCHALVGTRCSSRPLDARPFRHDHHRLSIHPRRFHARPRASVGSGKIKKVGFDFGRLQCGECHTAIRIRRFRTEDAIRVAISPVRCWLSGGPRIRPGLKFERINSSSQNSSVRSSGYGDKI